MLEFHIKLTHQISAVIDYSSSIIVYILMIEKNLNCLLSFSTSLCFSQCKRSHTCLRFHKLIIHSVIRTGFFMPLFTITVTTFFLKVSSVIFLIFCITSTVLISVLNPAMKRRDLKAFLAPIKVKREVSKRGKFRGKSLLPARHY